MCWEDNLLVLIATWIHLSDIFLCDNMFSTFARKKAVGWVLHLVGVRS